MTPNTFRQLREPLGSQRTVADMLGIGFRSLQRLEAGGMGDPIPEKYALAMQGLRAKGDNT